MFKAITLTEARQLESALGAAEQTFQMDEQTFRTLYDRTSRPLWSYLYRVSGNGALADDLLQESFYRILRVRLPEMNQDYMKNYLFRIATNLMRDHWRRGKTEGLQSSLSSEEVSAKAEGVADAWSAEQIDARSDVNRVLAEMKPRDRELLWLAYVEGSSHREIAEAVGLREQSVRPLLFRARQRLASLLRARGFQRGSARA
jgi:RNA polymerase sigma-70 factor (ECF subfamily)